MFSRLALLTLAVFAVISIGGCGNDDPSDPIIVDTDYDYVVVNNTGTDFDVYRHSSLNVGVWEPMEPLGAWHGAVYSSEVSCEYVLRFCLPGDGPEDYQAGVNYLFYSTETQYWVVNVNDIQP